MIKIREIFKSKKTKEILRLQKRIEYLESVVKDINKLHKKLDQFLLPSNARPYVIQTQGSVIPLKSSCMIMKSVPGVSVEHYKTQIAQDLAKNLDKFIEYDVEDDDSGVIVLTGALKVVK